MRSASARSWVSHLRIGARLIGIIGFANRADRRAFTALEQRVALRISERVALAIDNARIARERSEIAETLQNGLRPSALPMITGWSLSALDSPAGRGEPGQARDYYDLHRIEDGWLVRDRRRHRPRCPGGVADGACPLRAAGRELAHRRSPARRWPSSTRPF